MVVAISVGLVLNWGDQKPLGQIIPGSSTDNLPSYLVVLQVALSIASTFVVAMFGVGRGSTIVFLIILMASLGGRCLAFLGVRQTQGVNTLPCRRILDRFVGRSLFPDGVSRTDRTAHSHEVGMRSYGSTTRANG
jgi:hypothetical protein